MIFKHTKHLGKSGKNDLDVMGPAGTMYRDEHKGTTFGQEKAWDILRTHATGCAEGEGYAELVGEDARPRPAGKQCVGKK